MYAYWWSVLDDFEVLSIQTFSLVNLICSCSAYEIEAKTDF